MNRDHLFSFIDAGDGSSDAIVNLSPRNFLEVDPNPSQRSVGKRSSNSFLSLGSAISSPNSPVSHGFGGNGSEQLLCFASAAELLEHVTRNWRKDFVTQDLRTEQAIQMFIKRPFFMLLSIDGPISDRFRRANKFVLLYLIQIFCITLFFAEAIGQGCLSTLL
jgi:hypothetical protein